jgi:signal peptidase II
VIGGALGNVVDRFLYGAVVDFLDFHIAGWHYPTFNIADSFVFIGVVVLCIHSMFFEKKTL